ncbi:MAG: adhesin [Methanobrevibacter sp.]|uniref:adhesin n=1 Tax=Methanobrevibacter sp. TaxID=66852 RepID=UPI0025D06D75|nr:adhesin [Methanobrevibacter sp.]MBQ8016710.1 adhesin [Methanobrevibacter sp.]
MAMKLKFTIIDYIIIILVIGAIIFAFVHITTDDSSDLQKTAFDESTVNKIPDTYLKYYKDGFITKATVEGFNSTNGERITLNGTVVWQDDNGGNDVRLLIESNNKTYLAGLYRNIPNADIYIDHISLESNGEKYKNLCEIKVKPEEIKSLNDLTDNLPDNANYELTTVISLDSLNSKVIQNITNTLSKDKRLSIKAATSDHDNQLLINKATKENLKDANAILGKIDALTDEVTIRIYDCNDSQIDEISKNFDVINIRKF